MRASVLLGNGAGGKGLEKVPGPEGWEGNAMAGAAPASGQGGNGRLGINGKEGKGSRVRWTPAVCPPCTEPGGIWSGGWKLQCCWKEKPNKERRLSG